MKNFIFTLLVLLGVCFGAGASDIDPWDEITPEEHTYLNDFFGTHNILPPLPNKQIDLTEDQKSAFITEIGKQEQLAQNGDVLAMIRAGLLYEKRHAYTQSGEDRMATVRWYGIAANQDNPSALVKLGLCMLGGFGCVVEETTLRNVLTLYRRAGELGFTPAMYCYLGLMESKYLSPTQEDLKQAFVFNQRLVKLVPPSKDCVIYVSQANRLRKGEGCEITPQGLEQARVLYELAANSGSLTAMGNLALCHQWGIGGEQDFLNANLWFTKGAANGDAACMYALASNLYHHRGVKPRAENHVKLFKLMQKGAEQENSMCEAALGICLYRGIGCEICDEHFEEAFKYLSKAWEQGSDVAGYHLAFLLERGLGCDETPENVSKAASVYKQLVGKTFLPAFFPYGHHLQYGLGLSVTAIDHDQMVKCFVVDASQGGISAMERLMFCTLFGVGCEVNRPDVLNWYNTIRDLVREDGPTIDVAEVCMGWYYVTQMADDCTVRALKHFSKVVYNTPILLEMAVLNIKLKRHKEALDLLVQAGKDGVPVKSSLIDYLTRRWYADSVSKLGTKSGKGAKARVTPVLSHKELCKLELEAVLARHRWISEQVTSRLCYTSHFHCKRYSILNRNLIESFNSFLEKARAAKDDSAKKAEALAYDKVLDTAERQLSFLELGARHLLMQQNVEEMFKLQWGYYTPGLHLFK